MLYNSDTDKVVVFCLLLFVGMIILSFASVAIISLWYFLDFLWENKAKALIMALIIYGGYRYCRGKQGVMQESE